MLDFYFATFYVLLQTANAGAVGDSGSLAVSTGSSSLGNTGVLALSTGGSAWGAAGDVSLQVGAGSMAFGSSFTAQAGATTHDDGVGGGVSVAAGYGEAALTNLMHRCSMSSFGANKRENCHWTITCIYLSLSLD